MSNNNSGNWVYWILLGINTILCFVSFSAIFLFIAYGVKLGIILSIAGFTLFGALWLYVLRKLSGRGAL